MLSRYFTLTDKYQPNGGPRGRVHGSSHSFQFIHLWPWISVQNLSTICPIVVKLYLILDPSGKLTSWPTNKPILHLDEIWSYYRIHIIYLLLKPFSDPSCPVFNYTPLHLLYIIIILYTRLYYTQFTHRETARILEILRS